MVMGWVKMAPAMVVDVWAWCVSSALELRMCGGRRGEEERLRWNRPEKSMGKAVGVEEAGQHVC